MSKLDNPVVIHFTENSIPGLRQGVLTFDSKLYLKNLFQELIAECEYEVPDNDIDAPAFKQVDGNKLKQKVKEL
jgi:hypothetical protein